MSVSPTNPATIIPAPTLFYPIPRAVPVKNIPLSAKSQEIVRRDILRKDDNDEVTTMRALRWMASVEYGQKANSKEYKEIYAAFNQEFAPGINTFNRKTETMGRVQVGLSEFVDGDTAKIYQFFPNGLPLDSAEDIDPSFGKVLPINVRLDGIDTPESNPSSKLTNMVFYSAKYLVEEYGLSLSETQKRDLDELVKSRMVYLGKLAGAFSNGILEWANEKEFGMSIGPSYSRVSKAEYVGRKEEDLPMYDTLDYSDKYGRLLGRFYTGAPDQEDDLLHAFVGSQLLGVMKNAKSKYYEPFIAGASRYADILSVIEKQNPALAAQLQPKTAPNPVKIFSSKNCTLLAGAWITFTGKNPEAANDIQSLLVYCGMAPAYPKYRGHLSWLDLEAERFALGRSDGTGIKKGIASDWLSVLLRPNDDPEDPDHSPMFVKYKGRITDGRSLDPWDPRDGKK